MKKATIYDVAREAGVSLATVSRVINGSSVVREKTKEKVMKVIDELNFKPNQIARGLATNKTTTIAIIFPQSLFAHVKDMIGGIGDAGRTLDYNITIFYLYNRWYWKWSNGRRYGKSHSHKSRWSYII